MFVNWKGVIATLAGLAVVALVCALNLKCSSGPTEDSTIAKVKGELAVGKQAMRNQQADDLARLACDLRALAKRYAEQGEQRKAHRAIGTAQELDRKIKELRRAE